MDISIADELVPLSSQALEEELNPCLVISPKC